jgi:hypothetical protein
MAVYGMGGPMNNKGRRVVAGGGPVVQTDNRPPVDQVVASILGDSGIDIQGYGNFGSGSGTRMKPSDILANQKFQYDIAKDDLARAQELNKRDALINYYKSGAYRSGIDSQLSGYDTMRGTSEAAIRQQLADSLAGIGESYGKAQGLTEQGYGDLINYLAANQQDPYAQVRVQNVAPVQLEAQGLLEARGALSPDVLAYQQAVSSAGQSGAEQYQNLLNVLSSLNKSGNVSRANEAQMGRNMALTGLGEQRAGYESGLQSSSNQALTQLATQIAQKKLEAQAQADAQAQSLLETLAGLGIDVTSLLNPQTGGVKPPTAPVEDLSNLPLDLNQIDFSGLNNMFNPGTSPVAQVQPPSGPNMSLSQDVLDQLAARRRGF